MPPRSALTVWVCGEKDSPLQPLRGSFFGQWRGELATIRLPFCFSAFR